MLLLIGPSATGKTEVGKELTKKYNIKKLITYTTRPMRTGEVNGIDYHFIDYNTFIKMKNDNLFFESVCYSGNYYATLKSDLVSDKYVIVDPVGLDNYINGDIAFKSVYLNASKDVRVSRMKKRLDKESDILKRIELDEIHFNEECMKKCDLVINVDDLTISEICDKVVTVL